jgi:hypothetical protein
LVKVQRHINATPYGVYWPKRAGGRITLFGRPLLKYEHMEYLAFDPDSLALVPQRLYIDTEP